MLSWFGFPRSGAWDKDLYKYVLLQEGQFRGKKDDEGGNKGEYAEGKSWARVKGKIPVLA